MYIPTLEGGGAERVFVNLANYFVSKKVDVIFISSSLGVYGKDLSLNVNFILLEKKRTHTNSFWSFIKEVLFIKAVLKKEKPDFIFSTLALGNIKAWCAYKLCGVKKTKLVTRQANVLNTASKNKILNLLLKQSFKNSKLIIANSYDTQDSIIEICKSNGYMDKIEVIGNPVFDNKIVEKANTRIDLSFLKFGQYILNVGRLTKEKDHLTLLTAYSKLLETVKIDLIILGEGALKNVILDKIKELNIEDSVHILGFVDNPYPYYKNAKLFALTSNTEGFGNVIVEALAFDLPVVCMKCKGGPSFILGDNEYGYLVDLGDVDQFVENLKFVLLKDDSPRKVRTRALDFSLENIGEQYLKAFERVV